MEGHTSSRNRRCEKTVSTAPLGVRRQLTSDLSLLKMATICGYPGASPRWLPFIHAGFPAGPKSLSAKYYGAFTRRDAKKIDPRDSKALVCYKERTYIQLPELFRSNNNRRPLTRNDIGYVQKNKVCFKLKGINPKQAYSVNRLRPSVSDQHRHGLACLRINSKRSPTLLDMNSYDSWNVALESVAKATSQGAHRDLRGQLSTRKDIRSGERVSSGTAAQRLDEHNGHDSRELKAPEHEAPRSDVLVEARMRRTLEKQSNRFVPGLRPRKLKEGQALGHVVSPRRLHDLLRNDKNTLPYTVYVPNGQHACPD